jgi:DNA-binding transcriptional LysR family regulator
MLDEASRRMSSDAMLRVGMAAEFASRLTPRLPQLCTDAGVGPGFEVLTDVSDKLAAAFRQSTLDVALVIGAEGGPGEVERWSAPLRWFGESTRRKQPLRLVVAPQGTAIRDAAIGSLRDGAINFDIVGSSADFAVLAAAAAAGLGVTPMIDGLAPENLKPCPDKNLPALAPATISLLARSEALARAGRRWVEDAISTLQRI